MTKEEIEIIRVKPIPGGYSVLVQFGEVQRGFSFRADQNLHQNAPNGEPRYLKVIRKELAREAETKNDNELAFQEVLKTRGKKYKSELTKEEANAKE